MSTRHSWTTCSRSGSAATPGGSALSDIQCVRWSCQTATGSSAILRHDGARPPTSSPPTTPPKRSRLATTDGDVAFSNAPPGPIRRYGSPAYPSTTSSPSPLHRRRMRSSPPMTSTSAPGISAPEASRSAPGSLR
jgi:hypothetical protein